jgi:hypothetical protein
VIGEGQGRSEQTTRPSASGTIRPAAPAAPKRDGRITIWVFAEWSLISAVRRWRRPRVSAATYWDYGWIVTLADPERPGAQISLMTHDATAPVIPDVSVQVNDVDACHAAAVQAGAEIV